jgi:glutathione synthase/RimK-type ligase-like ATP-grasp enzyme
VARYDLAILHNPDETLPPSDEKALSSFIKAGKSLGVDVELIDRNDYSRLAEYDALFIRETTRINHYTYRFSKKAESEGMVVIDDPQSILRCTNKVYLAELLRAHRVPTPNTVILGKRDLKAAEEAIGYPMVLKVPDGSFSQGVYKAENPEQMREYTELLFKTSELILAQEFVYTEFDWRIGILNRETLYASQYFMSRKHWQIVRYGDEGKVVTGGYKTWAVEDIPEEVVSMALKAADPIGYGLYGVDLKQTANGIYVIEVNDNPSIESRVEDKVLKDELYLRIMKEFVRRIDKRRMV